VVIFQDENKLVGKTKKLEPAPPTPSTNAPLASQPLQTLKTIVDPSAETFDLMIDELQPIEEMEGMAFGKGNRNLTNLNLSYNRITAPVIIESLTHAPVINPILERVSFEGNPVEPMT
jgi:hypothetical protein